MSVNPNPAPNPGSAIPAGGDWKQAFGADATQALESFKEPGDFFKQYQTLSTELTALKEKPTTFDWRKDQAAQRQLRIKGLAQGAGRR